MHRMKPAVEETLSRLVQVDTKSGGFDLVEAEPRRVTASLIPWPLCPLKDKHLSAVSVPLVPLVPLFFL